MEIGVFGVEEVGGGRRGYFIFYYLFNFFFFVKKGLGDCEIIKLGNFLRWERT